MRDCLGIIGVALIIAGVALLSLPWSLIVAGSVAVTVELSPYLKRRIQKEAD